MAYQQVPSGDEINQISYQMCQHKKVAQKKVVAANFHLMGDVLEKAVRDSQKQD